MGMMGQQTQRYLIPAEGPEVEPIRIALALLGQKCADLGQHGLVLVPKMDTLTRTTVQQGLGPLVAGLLLKGHDVVLPGGGLVSLRTERTFRDSLTSHIILAIYPSGRMFDQLDEAKYSKAIIVVPWRMESVREWQTTWNPHVIGEPDTEHQQLIDNPVVVEGLKRLTNALGPGTPELSGLDDRDRAKQLLQQLWQNNEVYDPDDIRAWALRHGWPPRSANQLRQYAQDIKAGKRMRVRHPLWRSDIVDELRRTVEAN
jgi:hypothetical protein